jgi:hypothetical protein
MRSRQAEKSHGGVTQDGGPNSVKEGLVSHFRRRRELFCAKRRAISRNASQPSMRKLILTVLLTSAAASGARAVLSSHD